MTIKRGLMALVLLVSAAGVAAAAGASVERTTTSRPAVLGRTRFVASVELWARFSANGAWMLISDGLPTKSPGSELNGPMYIGRTDEGRVHLLGMGGPAIAISDNGSQVADECSEFVVCIEQTDTRATRRVRLPCIEGSHAAVYMASDFRALVVACKEDYTAMTYSIEIESHMVRTKKIGGELEPEAVSADGSTVILAPVERARGPLYVYRRGRMTLLSFRYLDGISSNGQFIVAGDGNKQLFLQDLATEQRRLLHISSPFREEGSGNWIVANDGGMVLYPELDLSRPLEGLRRETLKLVNVESGTQTAIVVSPTGFRQFGMSPDGRQLFYVVWAPRLSHGVPAGSLYVAEVSVN